MHDMITKGRDDHSKTTRGADHKLAKLNDETVREMRRRSASGTLATVLAREYGVTITAACNAIKRHTWAHVE